MESDYSRNRDSRQNQQKPQESQQQKQFFDKPQQTEEFSPTFHEASQMLQSGARLRDLSPEELKELAATVGNQTMRQLLRGGGELPLAPAPPGREASGALPETEVDIRWPILCAPPSFARDGPLPGSVFPIECFRPMGQYAESGVIPNG